MARNPFGPEGAAAFHDQPRLTPHSAPDPKVIASRYYDLFNQRRFDEVAAMISPQACFIHRPTKQRLIGPSGYRTFVEAWVRAFPDASVKIAALTVEEGYRVKVDLIGRGTHEGMLDLGEIVFPPTGRQVELPFRQYLDIRRGEIVDAVLEFDLDAMRRLLSPE